MRRNDGVIMMIQLCGDYYCPVGKNIQKNCTKERHDPDNHDGVITHLEADIPECEVKWALESITPNKASGGDGLPVEWCISNPKR